MEQRSAAYGGSGTRADRDRITRLHVPGEAAVLLRSEPGEADDEDRGDDGRCLIVDTHRSRRPQDRVDGDDPPPRREWLVTNGLGGYASGTVAGVVTRRYHGLLVASLPAPLGRMVMLNHLLERVRLPDRQRVVARRRGRGRRARTPPIAPEHLVEFRLELGPAGLALSSCRASTIEKRVLMPHGQNTVHVTYRLLEGTGRSGCRCGRRSSSAATKRSVDDIAGVAVLHADASRRPLRSVRREPSFRRCG